MALRKERSDAERNRQLLLDAALPLLSDPAADSTPAAIARAAGVGVGTLYRHFPNREALAEAVYRDDLAALCATAAVLLETHDAQSALRLWLLRCVDHTFMKHGMSDALQAAIAQGATPYSNSRELLNEALEAILSRAREDGSMRTDVSADDILIAFSGLVTAGHEYGDRAQALRLTQLLLDALTTPR